METTDKLTESKFLMFENENNSCWLDAAVVLVAHNKTMKKLIKECQDSKINNIISTYDGAMSLLNDPDLNIEQRINKTREVLQKIQINTVQYLQQFLKHKVGEPDSAFCALLNLLRQDSSGIYNDLTVSWLWKKLCTNCGDSSLSSLCKKPIITLTKVKNFQPEYPSSIYMCSCKTEQEMRLIYKELPSCLMFHFEKGAGNKGNPPVTFTIKERVYELTSIIILEKSKNQDAFNHFITWIRDPSLNKWLDCNDLNTNIVSFSSEQPEFDLKDVYMYVYESFDGLGKVSNEISAVEDQGICSSKVELIDISDEAEEAKNALENTSVGNVSSKSGQIAENARLPLVARSVSNTHKVKEVITASEEQEKLIVSNSQNLKMASENNSAIPIVKSHDVIRTEKSVDYDSDTMTRTRVKNNRNKSQIHIKHASELENINSQMVKKKEDGLKTKNAKVAANSDDSRDVKGINMFDLNKNKEDSYSNKIISAKSVQRKEYSDNNDVLSPSKMKYQNLLHSDLSGSSVAHEVLHGSKVKASNLLKSDVCSVQENPKDLVVENKYNSKQNYEKRDNSFKKGKINSEDTSIKLENNKKRKNTSSKCQEVIAQVKHKKRRLDDDDDDMLHAEQHALVVQSSDRVVNEQHTTRVSPFKKGSKKSKLHGQKLTKTSVRVDTDEEDELSEYDERELQLKMKHTSLKNLDYKKANSEKIRKQSSELTDDLEASSATKRSPNKARKRSRSRSPKSSKKCELQSRNTSPAGNPKSPDKDLYEDIVHRNVESVFVSYLFTMKMKQ